MIIAKGECTDVKIGCGTSAQSKLKQNSRDTVPLMTNKLWFGCVFFVYMT